MNPKWKRGTHLAIRIARELAALAKSASLLVLDVARLAMWPSTKPPPVRTDGRCWGIWCCCACGGEGKGAYVSRIDESMMVLCDDCRAIFVGVMEHGDAVRPRVARNGMSHAEE